LLYGKAASNGPSILLPRIGFSAGVASNSSIAGFLTGSPFPYRVAGSRTLFDLAKAQGFSTFYLSAQKRSPLDMAGSLGSIDRIETNESNSAAFRKRRDWLLVDLLERLPTADRSFVFLYQRVNHTPYYNHQVGELEPFHAPPRSREEILHNYDVGLRTYDRNTSDLLNTLQKRPGALYVIVTADHGELLGEDGIYGHNKSGSLHCASVPVMLFTNRPHAPVVRDFAESERLDAFTVSRLLMRMMGVGIHVDGYDPDTFYVSNALPFGRSGYIGARRVNPNEYSVVLNDRNGSAVRQEVVSMAAFQVGERPERPPASKLAGRPKGSVA
jgi:glucan phosphoethanolaminetransferase (alkaline phosphatase superfamily)